MDYFVHIENSQYFHWQTELLIESFNQNNCSDNLLIAISEVSDTSFNELFLKNMGNHKRKCLFTNFGIKKGFTSLNKYHCLEHCLRRNLLSQPFCVLEPDLVFSKEIEDIRKDFSVFTYAIDPFFTFDVAEREVGPFWEWLNIDKDLLESKWIQLGDCYAFNKFPETFLLKTMADAEKLAFMQLISNGSIWNKTPELSLIVNVFTNMNKVYCKGEYNMVSSMVSSGGTSFISYKDGVPPYFSKSMFSYQPPMYMALGDPIDILADMSFSPAADHVSNIAKGCLQKRI